MSAADTAFPQREEQIAKPAMGSRAALLLLAGITVLGAGLRLYRLGDWSFWIDEVFTVSRVQTHVDLQQLSGYLHPLSITFTSAMFQLFGVNEWSARLFPAVVGIITIPLLFFAVRKVFDTRIALLAALLLAIAPWHLFWSQNARFYTTLMLLYAVAAYALYDGFERDRPWQFLIFYLALYFSVRERYLALFLLPVVGAYLFSLWLLRWPKPPGLRIRNLSLLLAPALFVTLAAVYRFVSTGEFVLSDIWQYFFGFPNISPPRLLLAIVYRLGAPVVTLGVFAGGFMLLQKSRAALFTLLSALLPILLLLVLSTFSFTVDRYVFTTLPFWLILAALAVVGLGEQLQGAARFLALGVLVMVVATSLGDVALYYEFQNGHRPDWKGAFALVSQCRQEGDLVATTRPEMGEYYLSENVGNVNRLQVAELEAQQQPVWIVVDEATGPLDPAIGAWMEQNAQLVEIRPVFLPGKSLSIRTYLYNPAGRAVCAAGALTSTPSSFLEFPFSLQRSWAVERPPTMPIAAPGATSSPTPHSPRVPKLPDSTSATPPLPLLEKLPALCAFSPLSRGPSPDSKSPADQAAP